MMATPQKRCPAQPVDGRVISPVSISSRFSEPNRANTCRMPMAPTKGGMIIGTSSSPPSSAFAGKR